MKKIMKRVSLTIACLIFALAVLAACSAPDRGVNGAASLVAPSAPASDGAAFEVEEAAEAAPPPAASFFMEDSESYFTLPILEPFARGRSLVYTVTMDLQTTEFMPGMRRIFNTAGEMGGYITFAEVHGHDLRWPNSERHGNFMFRIPSERLDDFIVVMENNFNIWWYRQTTEDETERHQETISQTENLREQESRLLQELADAEDLETRIEIENMLSQVRNALREFEAAQARIVDAVIYSTVHIRLYEVLLQEDYEPEPEPEATFSERLSNAVSNSIDGVAAFGQGLLLVMIAIAPVLIVIIAVGAIVLLIIKRSKASSISRILKKPEEKEDGQNESEEDN